jgi:hypothetical protein
MPEPQAEMRATTQLDGDATIVLERIERPEPTVKGERFFTQLRVYNNGSYRSRGTEVCLRIQEDIPRHIFALYLDLVCREIMRELTLMTRKPLPLRRKPRSIAEFASQLVALEMLKLHESEVSKP